LLVLPHSRDFELTAVCATRTESAETAPSNHGAKRALSQLQDARRDAHRVTLTSAWNITMNLRRYVDALQFIAKSV
jgi:hypothetical protein